MKPLACAMEFCRSLCSMKIPAGFGPRARAHACGCLNWMRACMCPLWMAHACVFLRLLSSQKERSFPLTGGCAPSVSCHVWLPSVGRDNTVGSTTGRRPINGLLANGMTVARHTTLALTNRKLLHGQEFCKRMWQRKYRLYFYFPHSSTVFSSRPKNVRLFLFCTFTDVFFKSQAVSPV